MSADVACSIRCTLHAAVIAQHEALPFGVIAEGYGVEQWRSTLSTDVMFPRRPDIDSPVPPAHPNNSD